MIKRLTPHILAIVIFLVVSVSYFSPQYQGKDVRQYDNVQANGTRASIDRSVEQYGEHPQWIDNMFGGMPSYTFDMESVSKHILEPVVSVLNFIQRPASSYFLLMVGFYFMALCFGISPFVAIVGALAWGLSSYFYIIYTAGHIMKLIAMVYIAPLIGSIYLAYNRNLLLGGSLAALFTALEIRSVHPQVTYYFFFVILALIISVAVAYNKRGELSKFAMKSVALVGFAILGVGANAVYLYYTIDYTKESTRGKPILTTKATEGDKGLDKEYITAWSYGKAETLNLLVPNLYGGTSEGGFPDDGELYNTLKQYKATHLTQQLPAYWGPQPITSGPVYIGAVVIFLFVLSLFLVRGAMFWGMLSVTILAILLAWGKYFMPLTDLFIDYFPLYNKFRTVSMILLIVQFTAPLLAMFALERVIKSTDKKVLSSLRKTTLIVGGFLLLMVLFGAGFMSFSSPADTQYNLPQDVVAAMQVDREAMMNADAIRSLIFVLLAAGIVYLMLKLPKYNRYTLLGLALLVVIDILPVSKRYLNNDHFVPLVQAQEIPMTYIDESILEDKENYRVANFTVNPFSDATTSRYHRSIGGYSAVKPRRYQDLIEKYLSKQDMNIYSMLNTKYLIVPEGETAKIVVNDEALGNAWFVNGVSWVKTPDEEINMIGAVDLASVAVVNEEFRSDIEGKFLPRAEQDTIYQTQYRPNLWKFNYRAQSPRLAVLSEMYFPNGWGAKIADKPLQMIRVNYDLFGVVVPEGEGEIVFEFKVPKLGLIDGIAIACSIAILGMIIFSIYISYKKRDEREK